MTVRIGAERLPASNGTVNVGIQNLVSFGHGMREHCHLASMEKVKDAVLDVSEFGTQLVDVIAKQVGLWTPQIVSQFRQAPQADNAFCECTPILFLEVLKPLQDGNRAIVFLKEDNFGSCHAGGSLFHHSIIVINDNHGEVAKLL
jgi:hypothetical protein